MPYMDYSVPDRKLEPDFVKEPQCPICGEVCEKIYIGRLNNEVYGCNYCIRWVYADEYDMD